MLEVCGSSPRREAREKVRAQIAGMGADMDFAFGGRAEITGGNNLAMLDEDHGIASDFDLTKEMGVEENGSAALAFAADDVAYEVATHGIEAGGGLVEEDEVGFVD